MSRYRRGQADNAEPVVELIVRGRLRNTLLWTFSSLLVVFVFAGGAIFAIDRLKWDEETVHGVLGLSAVGLPLITFVLARRGHLPGTEHPISPNRDKSSETNDATQPDQVTPIKSSGQRGDLWLWLSLILFGLALMTPALFFKAKDSMPGFVALLIGWLGLFVGQFAWFANLFWGLGLLLLLLGRPKGAIVVIAVGLLIGLHTFALIGEELPGDEGGVTRTIVSSAGPGTYLWLSSFLTLLIASWRAGRQ